MVSLVVISAEFSNGLTPVLLTMVVTTKVTLSLCLATSLSMVYFLMPVSSTKLWLKSGVAASTLLTASVSGCSDFMSVT